MGGCGCGCWLFGWWLVWWLGWRLTQPTSPSSGSLGFVVVGGGGGGDGDLSPMVRFTWLGHGLLLGSPLFEYS